MISATISDLEEGLSACLRRVKAEESILVPEHRAPVARIVPIERGEEAAKDVDDMDMDAKPARLEHVCIAATTTVAVTPGLSRPLLAIFLEGQGVPAWLYGLGASVQIAAMLPIAPIAPTSSVGSVPPR